MRSVITEIKDEIILEIERYNLASVISMLKVDHLDARQRGICVCYEFLFVSSIKLLV